MKINLPLLYILTFLLVGCSSGSKENTTNQSKVNGEWRSDGVVLGGRVGEFVWSLNDGVFIKTIEYLDDLGPTIESGTYVIGPEVVMPSGVTANEVDITYEYSEKASITKLDIVHIDVNGLYFGSENINELCEGEFYEETRHELEVINGVVRNLDEINVCLSRPTSLNFERVYRSE